ncbi:uncharacterized protein LOC131433858 [Malaya genurostris]|uniref:uncharacterized protein LOC131433858 n=1 Tax=Malaya genurostris TaxID=325434 RepID=UPI0026F3BF43|nr:uncharacterized protein LOC131433858 [Malaya genurostris]
MSRSNSVVEEEFSEEFIYSQDDPLQEDDNVTALLPIDNYHNLSDTHNIDNKPKQLGLSQNELPNGLFGCWLLVAVRDFKGHSSGKEMGKWGVSGNNTEQFLHSCWLLSKQYLKREVIFTADESGVAMPSWSSRSVPQEDDFVRFALFNDKANHRCYTVDKVTASLLQNWRSKEVHLLLHVYSLSVNNKSVFKTVCEILLQPEDRDKAGAVTNKALAVLAQKLRDIHSDSWQANNIAWMMWANTICCSAPHRQEELLLEAPPVHLIKLFSVKELPRLKSIRRSFAVAHSVNIGYHDEIVSLREAFEDLDITVQNLLVKMQLVKRCLESLEQRNRTGESFISAAEEAVQVQESELGVSLAGRVRDMDDIDH